jgi:hypothetical protein
MLAAYRETQCRALQYFKKGDANWGNGIDHVRCFIAPHSSQKKKSHYLLFQGVLEQFLKPWVALGGNFY